MKNEKITGLLEKHCAECNKIIFPIKDWVYKIEHKYYCSYKCWRKNGGGEYGTRRGRSHKNM